MFKKRASIALAAVSWAAILGWLLLQPASAATAPEGEVTVASPAEPAELVIANREIVTIRSEVFGAEPADRVQAISERIEALVAHGGPLQVSTRPINGGIALLIDGQLIFRVLDADVDKEGGETAAAVAALAARNLQLALGEMREARDSAAMLGAIGWSTLATIGLVVLLWMTWRLYRWLARKATAFAMRETARIDKFFGELFRGPLGPAPLVVAPLRLAAALLVMFFTYEWLGIVLQQFPYTRPWGEKLLGNLLDTAGSVMMIVLRALPGLLFVALIFLVARFFVRALRLFFNGVEQGRVQVAWLDETTARPTGQLVSGIVWLLAFVAAYPYIPGSDSEAFKGIGVFIGLMLSIGSSGVVNQAVSGLMLMYARSLRPGEFVKVGEVEGIVKSVGFLVTRIETLRNETVTIPNAVILGNVTRNFSRPADGGLVRYATTVTIGYDAPWRQVSAMLQEAAARSERILRDPPARILQTGLLDHAVEYTVLVSVREPAMRLGALNELHANIQDVFNEYGVQIMSPRYEADATEPKMVPPQQWFKAPAVAPAAAGETTVSRP